MLYFHKRNFGCRLNTDYFYKDLRVAVLENEYLRISVLIDKGTDIFEFLYKPKDMDFMWLSPWGINSPAKFVPTVSSREGNFMDYYEGGWQEVLPNFGYGCTYYGGAEEGLHGEICLIPWEFSILEDNPSEIAIKFSVRSYRTPFHLEKTLMLKKDDPKLYISEKLKNEGYTKIELMWTHHPTYGGVFLDDSTIIDVPGNRVRLIYKPQPLGGFMEIPDTPDAGVKWPRFAAYSGREVDFSKSPTLLGEDPEESLDEICLGDLKSGWYSVTNLNCKTGLGLKWDKNVFPYIWIWRMYGKGCSSSPWFGRIQCMALELCSSLSPYGIIGAVSNKTVLTLEPQEEMGTEIMAIAYERESSVTEIRDDGQIL